MLVVSSGAFMLGSGCLAPVLGFVFHRAVAGILGLLLLPLFTYLFLKKRDISEENRRAVVFASTLTSNFLIGFALSTITLSSYPPTPFFLPLLFATIILYFADEICDLNRYVFYSIVAVIFLIGCALYSLFVGATMQYCTNWVVFCAATVFDLQ
uniref:NADH dehydrogenase subunit 6 n=1 Tax=Romanomermis culicivorax TaxID=13658 RepID=A0A915L1A4_ROMCU